MIMKKTMKKCSVLEVGGKPQLRENPWNQVGTENPIHLWTERGLEPGPPEVKGEEKKHYANLTPAGRNWSILDTDVACYDVEGRKRRLPSKIYTNLSSCSLTTKCSAMGKIKLLGVRGVLRIHVNSWSGGIIACTRMKRQSMPCSQSFLQGLYGLAIPKEDPRLHKGSCSQVMYSPMVLYSPQPPGPGARETQSPHNWKRWRGNLCYAVIRSYGQHWRLRVNCLKLGGSHGVSGAAKRMKRRWSNVGLT